MATKQMKIKAVCGTYKAKDGTEKQDWQEIGRLFVNEDGTMSGTIKAVPFNWNGRFIATEQQPQQTNNNNSIF